ncbi:MAG: ABC transporter ATP-binding protein [Dehalococcoidia bacterium]|nr:ABC transporter ATP-binding protein [Dehalococcoidia bacterium]
MLNGTRSRHGTGSELRAERLSVGYGKRTVVEEASTTFPPGAITAVVGANACGKSTLLRALARLLPPKSGAALLDGEPVHRGSRKQLAQKLGILPQSPVTPPDLTVGELVAAGRFPHQRWWRQWSDVDKHAVERDHACNRRGRDA